ALDRKTKLRNLYVNDQRALMASKTAASKGGSGTFAVSSGQASWAWSSGSGSDGINYSTGDIPEIASNKDDLEIVNGTTWNENIVCTRDVVTNGGNRTLLLQQPYGSIAQLPGWNAGFSVSGTHTIYNAYELLSAPGTFFFDKTTGTLYYIPRSGEDMASADVEAPVAEQLLVIAGTSKTDRVKNITFQGITFANTDYSLYKVDSSYGKASVQGATVFIAYGNGDWHASKYEIVDTFPAMIEVNSAESIDIVGNVIKHSGNEGIGMYNDVINSNIIGNSITDMAGSGITIGHPQHVYVGDGGTHAKYSAAVEGVCTNDTINNNLIYNVSTIPGFGGHAGITAFFVDTLTITHNHIHTTAYIGLSLGWGWKNFKDSTTCKDNVASYNRFNNIMTRLHDSGAIYTIGQEPGTTINENYVKGIPPATSGPTYGLHNDEGSAYITENDSVLDIDKNVKYTINCEDFGDKHDLTILRTYATVNKMGANPPSSQIDTPVVVADAVWPVKQYGFCVASGVEDEYRGVIPTTLLAIPDYVFPASCSAPSGTATLTVRSSGDATNTVWFAPAGTASFAEGGNMTKAAGDATSIAVPTTAGNYKLFVVNAQGQKVGESAAQLRVGG
ncbi:MAG: right-handed parallel beta-helix repeat-containing protein, partial [Polyangiaceae bacterium]|nr:right-handed parallel beta-helix repeat-containing protein [Polyangiaceae bacterium]